MARIAQEEAAWNNKPESWDWASDLEQPRDRELLWALTHGVANTLEQEIYVRTKLWWAGNGPHRGYKRKSPMNEDEAQHNMTALLQLRRTMADDKRDLRLEGELLRELGRFLEAIQMLEGLAGDDSRASIILEKVSAGDRIVCEVGRSEFSY